MSETIVAIASPPGMGAVSVIRLSGARAFKIAISVVRGEVLPKPRRVGLRSIQDDTGRVIDEGLLITFEGPGSYTGEDVVEFTGHGGVMVTRRVLERFVEAGAIPAGPGEFTQRAFMNGRMDLTQAEAVMDLISAQTSLALRSANEQLDGRLGRTCENIRAKLLGATAHLEAFIDFPEEDIDPEVGAALCRTLSEQSASIAGLLSTADQGRILREGVRTVIFGKPNVGKSSLLNRLLGYQRAIVSSKEGTTRDTIEEVVNLRGIPLRLIDTAGVRESSDEIEQEGIAMTHGQLARADLVLVIWDLSESFVDSAEVSIPDGARRLDILNKSDLEDVSWAGVKGLRISCESGSGFEDLESAISKLLSLDEAQWGDHSVAVNARHQACLTRAQSSLVRAITSLRAGDEPELTALDLREALTAIGEIAGIVDTEEILGEIFGNFCIGK
ncbi:tRNA uridine-5-carboxymethylaminomethyl(34) synthesis GTPase MnmE [Akkermansiaceae bacterium]|jgi:tRNA modification GTPase|nr:tRNA uridine-5-carboxymethylaminomethyl(34) synthesis GTPase MnmE [Akkermansiaceae bacterium]RZN89314.1 MAG: tRNA uridine-5-carboxymethylaminomethyl(34) synthesis GTPase MnmE [Verrucomicrobiaceae bacterium]|tara:strand:+ start:340 stop:1671 length:1332 start_codon:yes stop_codon:yes gene_type:complete